MRGNEGKWRNKRRDRKVKWKFKENGKELARHEGKGEHDRKWIENDRKRRKNETEKKKGKINQKWKERKENKALRQKTH